MNERSTPEAASVLEPTARISRRQFLGRNAALLGVATLIHASDESQHVEITRHRVPMPGIREPVRVVQVSDLHRSWCVSEDFIRGVVHQTTSLRPDLVLLTGDFVTSSSDYAYSCCRILAEIQAPLGSWAILGNHDYWCDDSHGAPIVATTLASANIRLLMNDSVRLDNGLRLVGVDDCRAGHPDHARAFGRVDPGEPILAMTHNPELFGEMCRYDCLTISGHTHGGQVTIPWAARTLMSSRMRYLRGWYRERYQPGRLYVSRGVGVVHVPLRLNAPPEIAVFDLIPT